MHAFAQQQREARPRKAGMTPRAANLPRRPLADLTRTAAYAPLTLQTKLVVGSPSDSYEQEADRISQQVMRMPETRVQRACACGGGCPRCRAQPAQEPAKVQAKATSANSAAQAAVPEAVHEVLRSPGRPLEGDARAFMEARFGHDFSAVRVHSDARAAQSARALDARAYTVGRNVVFGEQQYAPGMPEGRRLLAHELAHVLQQGGGGANGTVMRQANKPVAPSFSSCSGPQQGQIDATVIDARKALNRATHVVATSWGKPDAISATNKQLLLMHFHTSDRDDLRKILGKYISLQGAFDAGLKFKCESTCDKTATTSTCGYAYNTMWFGGRGPIHICFDPAGCDFTTTAANNQVALVIHEAAHRHTGVDDKVYQWDKKYATLSADDAMDNADSYAWFAVSV